MNEVVEVIADTCLMRGQSLVCALKVKSLDLQTGDRIRGLAAAAAAQTAGFGR